MLFDDLICSFQKVGTGTEKAQAPARVLTLGTNKWKPDERSLVDKEKIESRCDGSSEESLIGSSAEFKNDARFNREKISEVGQNAKTEETMWQP